MISDETLLLIALISVLGVPLWAGFASLGLFDIDNYLSPTKQREFEQILEDIAKLEDETKQKTKKRKLKIIRRNFRSAIKRL